MNTVITSQMAQEINEIPDASRRQIESGLSQYIEAGRVAAAGRPRGFVTCARGTSDHAATFFKYVMETRTGLPVASLGPSIASVYKTKLQLEDFVCISISQSGGSPDLVALQNSASQGGARSVTFLNEVDSPLGDAADTVLPVYAGPEKAVAATKSFVNSLFATLGFVAGFTNDGTLVEDLKTLPELLEKALNCDWSRAELSLARAPSIFTVGRGPGLAVAAEAALKLKETCRIHAEVFSAAEVLHGPVVLAEDKFSALCFMSEDDARSSIDVAKDTMIEKGSAVFDISANSTTANTLNIPFTNNELLVPLLQITAFYKFVENLSKNLGENADAPEGLNKVTVTI